MLRPELGKCETRGHCRRILTITSAELAIFAKLFDDGEADSLETRLPQVRSREVLEVLRKFMEISQRLSDLRGGYNPTVMFDETFAQRDGIITRQEHPAFHPKDSNEWVVSGPHFFVGIPLNKTPRTRCTEKNHYNSIDLTQIQPDYLPRTVYRPGDRKGDRSKFYDAIANWPSPALPGFWPISKDEMLYWESLLDGEKLRLYFAPQADPAKPPIHYACFSTAEGDVTGVHGWLASDVGRPWRRLHHVHPVETEGARGLTGLAPAEQVARGFAGRRQFRGILVAHPVWTEIGGKQQGGQHGADSARFGTAGVAEGERIAFADVPQDDVTQRLLMRIVMVGQVFCEDLHFRNFPPLA